MIEQDPSLTQTNILQNTLDTLRNSRLTHAAAIFAGVVGLASMAPETAGSQASSGPSEQHCEDVFTQHDPSDLTTESPFSYIIRNFEKGADELKVQFMSIPALAGCEDTGKYSFTLTRQKTKSGPVELDSEPVTFSSGRQAFDAEVKMLSPLEQGDYESASVTASYKDKTVNYTHKIPFHIPTEQECATLATTSGTNRKESVTPFGVSLGKRAARLYVGGMYSLKSVGCEETGLYQLRLQRKLAGGKSFKSVSKQVTFTGEASRGKSKQILVPGGVKPGQKYRVREVASYGSLAKRVFYSKAVTTKSK